MKYATFLLAWLAMFTLVQADDSSLRKHLTFFASFDNSEHADFSKGDKRLYTAESLKREKVQTGLAPDAAVLDANGKYGKSLYYPKKTQKITFFKGGKNVTYKKGAYSTTISFWMSLTPDKDLPSGFVDPLQITDKKWNNASIFVDFDKDTPRVFRLGVYSDFKFWNPKNRKYDDIPDSERPLVSVKKPPFSSDRWTHVAIVLQGMNDKTSKAALFLDGKKQGDLAQQLKFTWEPDKVVVMLGIFYVGRIDDYAMFDRALSETEINRVRALKGGIKDLK